MNINIIGVSNTLSYGVVTKNIIKSLVELGHNVHFHPIHTPEYSESEKYIESSINTPFFEDAPQILIWHQHSFNFFLNGAGKKYGWGIFELDTLTETDRYSMNGCDELIVCSKWAKQICRNNLIKKPINIVPLGVDNSVFTQSPIKKDTTFTISFYNKWEIRKGHDNIPDILDKILGYYEFKLNVCCTNPFYTKKENQEWENLYKRKLGNKVTFFDRFSSQEELNNFIAESHVGLFPSKAEGWNLPVLEYMSVGRKVITTNYSAMTEFCNKDNSELVDINGYEPAIDGKWFWGHGSWATYDNFDFSFKLNRLLSAYYSNNDIFNYSGVETAKEFSWKNSAEKLVSILRS